MTPIFKVRISRERSGVKAGCKQSHLLSRLFLAWHIIWAWIWRQYVRLKCPALFKLHGTIAQLIAQLTELLLTLYLNLISTQKQTLTVYMHMKCSIHLNHKLCKTAVLNIVIYEIHFHNMDCTFPFYPLIHNSALHKRLPIFNIFYRACKSQTFQSGMCKHLSWTSQILHHIYFWLSDFSRCYYV
jgi:hypothetical protein